MVRGVKRNLPLLRRCPVIWLHPQHRHPAAAGKVHPGKLVFTCKRVTNQHIVNHPGSNQLKRRFAGVQGAGGLHRGQAAGKRQPGRVVGYHGFASGEIA